MAPQLSVSQRKVGASQHAAGERPHRSFELYPALKMPTGNWADTLYAANLGNS